MFGAFILSHQECECSLWIHIKGDIAYLHFFPASTHPGYRSIGTLPLADDDVTFLQINASEANAISVLAEAIVSVDVAYAAATEFLMKADLPQSVDWFEG